MTRRWRWWWGASILVHAGFVGSGLAFAPQQGDGRGDAVAPGGTVRNVDVEVAPRSATDIDLAVEPTSQGHAHLRPQADPVQPLGGMRNAQNINADERGAGGDGRSRERGQLLAQRADGVNLSPDLMNTLRANQVQRLDTGHTRASLQDRRSTPAPGYDPWISLHDGVLLLRTHDASQVPDRGARVSPGAAAVAARAPSPQASPDGLVAPTRAPHAGVASEARLAAGLAAGIDGHAPRVAGPAARAHASIEQGHASTTSDLAAARPSDDLDAEALANTLLHHSVAATVHEGAVRGDGIGGVGGGGAAGSGGGTASGGRARPYSDGSGWLSLDAPDDRYMRYFQDLRRRIHGLWEHAFPEDEAIQLHQGTVIVRFVIGADGRVRDVAVERRSGIDRFDHNVVAAMSGAQLPPIPSVLGRSELRISAPFVFRNPMVR